MDELFYKVRKLANLYDLAGIMSKYTPIDEYDPEVKDILLKCTGETKLSEMEGKIEAIFDYWFSGCYDHSKIHDLSKDLLELFEQYREKLNN